MKTRYFFPFDIPLLIYCAFGLVCAERFGFRINWPILYDLKYDLPILRVGFTCLLLIVPVIYLKRRYYEGLSHRSVLRGFIEPLHLQTWNDWRRWYELLRTVVAVKFCLFVYTHLKQATPILNDKLYDIHLARLDRWLHAGWDPIGITTLLSAAPWVIRSFDVLYVGWYVLKVAFFGYFLLVAERRRRWHFFTCYVLVMMIGGSLAIALPSLGPVYTSSESLSGSNMPIAHTLQQMLLEHYDQFLRDPGGYNVHIYEGIAAFPSLHVGLVVLFTAFAASHRPLFVSLLCYCAIVQVGSVLLGWHYAVDGYFAVALVLVIYFATRPAFAVSCQVAGAAALDDRAGLDAPSGAAELAVACHNGIAPRSLRPLRFKSEERGKRFETQRAKSTRRDSGL